MIENLNFIDYSLEDIIFEVSVFRTSENKKNCPGLDAFRTFPWEKIEENLKILGLNTSYNFTFL